MVLQLGDLRGLPPAQSVVQYEYQVIRDDCVDTMAANVPGWSRSPDSGLYKGCEALAYLFFIAFQRVNAQMEGADVSRATDANLQILGANHGILKLTDEADDVFRLRIVNEPRARSSRETENGIRSAAVAYTTLSLISAGVAARAPANGQDINVAVLKLGTGDPRPIEDLTAGERTAFQTYMRGPTIQPFAREFHVEATQQVTYTASVAAEFDANLYTEANVRTAIQEAVVDYAYAHDRLAQKHYHAAAQSACNAVPGVLNAVLSTVGSSPFVDDDDGPLAYNRHYAGPTSAAAVTVTLTPVY